MELKQLYLTRVLIWTRDKFFIFSKRRTLSTSTLINGVGSLELLWWSNRRRWMVMGIWLRWSYVERTEHISSMLLVLKIKIVLSLVCVAGCLAYGKVCFVWLKWCWLHLWYDVVSQSHLLEEKWWQWCLQATSMVVISRQLVECVLVVKSSRGA